MDLLMSDHITTIPQWLSVIQHHIKTWYPKLYQEYIADIMWEKTPKSLNERQLEQLTEIWNNLNQISKSDKTEIQKSLLQLQTWPVCAYRIERLIAILRQHNYPTQYVTWLDTIHSNIKDWNTLTSEDISQIAEIHKNPPQSSHQIHRIVSESIYKILEIEKNKK